MEKIPFYYIRGTAVTQSFPFSMQCFSHVSWKMQELSDFMAVFICILNWAFQEDKKQLFGFRDFPWKFETEMRSCFLVMLSHVLEITKKNIFISFYRCCFPPSPISSSFIISHSQAYICVKTSPHKAESKVRPSCILCAVVMQPLIALCSLEQRNGSIRMHISYLSLASASSIRKKFILELWRKQIDLQIVVMHSYVHTHVQSLMQIAVRMHTNPILLCVSNARRPQGKKSNPHLAEHWKPVFQVVSVCRAKLNSPAPQGGGRAALSCRAPQCPSARRAAHIWDGSSANPQWAERQRKRSLGSCCLATRDWSFNLQCQGA